MAVIPFCNRIIKNNKLGKLEHKNTLESNNRLDEVVKNIMLERVRKVRNLDNLLILALYCRQLKIGFYRFCLFF